MELHERIGAVRRAAGLTQEQLGELVGVSRQAVSKWESGQAVPDALTVAKLCLELRVSADYVLLGREPEERQETAGGTSRELPEDCPVCGRSMGGDVCVHCGYPVPGHPPRGGRYAVLFSSREYNRKEERTARLMKYCDFDQAHAQACLDTVLSFSTMFLARRDLTDDAAQWLAGRLQDEGQFQARIVLDEGEDEETLCAKPQSESVRPPAPPTEPIGCGGAVLIVAAGVILALVLLSFF